MTLLIGSELIVNLRFIFQGRPGDKGQKGELGNPGFDVFSAVKVTTKFTNQTEELANEFI